MFDFVSDEKKSVPKDVFTLKTPINKWLKDNPRVKRNRWISASKAYDVSIYDFVYGYFLANEEYTTVDDHFRMEIGNAIHSTLQEKLVKIGALEADSVERPYSCETYGFVGRIDGIIQSGAVVPKSKKIPDERMHFEIKSCSEHAYGNILTQADIPIYYRAQAEIYQYMSGFSKTLFCFVSRASDATKCLVYEGKGELLTEMKSKAEKIWELIAKRELPYYVEITKDEWLDKIKDVNVPLDPKGALERLKEGG